MGLLPSVDACMPRHTGIHARPSRIYAASTDEDRSTSPIPRHAYGGHCSSPRLQRGPDGIAPHNPVTRRTPPQPADQGGCTVDIIAGGHRTGFPTRRAKRRDYALSARPRSRTCVA